MALGRKPVIDISGHRFGRLVVLEHTYTRIFPNGGKRTMWKCRCDCGAEIVTQGQHLRTGRSNSCGCLQREIAAATNYRHGGRHTKLYGVWTQMLQRCENPKNKRYADWGGRGITVCDEWHDFAVFKADMEPTYAEGLTIERNNNDGPYSKANCRWATMLEQMQNTRPRKKVGSRCAACS